MQPKQTLGMMIIDYLFNWQCLNELETTARAICCDAESSALQFSLCARTYPGSHVGLPMCLDKGYTRYKYINLVIDPACLCVCIRATLITNISIFVIDPLIITQILCTLHKHMNWYSDICSKTSTRICIHKCQYVIYQVRIYSLFDRQTFFIVLLILWNLRAQVMTLLTFHTESDYGNWLKKNTIHCGLKVEAIAILKHTQST